VPELLSRLQAALGDTYRVEHELTPGQMSQLFQATEASLNRQVVVKAAGRSRRKPRRSPSGSAAIRQRRI
jgi:hypothetical protein